MTGAARVTAGWGCAAVLLVSGACAPPTVSGAIAPSSQLPLDVTIVDDEAVAVLALLELGEMATDAHWARLFRSEGYIRLQQREEAMQRAFTDSSFREFVQTAELRARKGVLARTLERWKAVDASTSARRALAHLPPNTVLRARIYPVIKPRSNSFVFETATNPAIFLYLDPAVSPEKFDNTLAHELHHIGYAAACRDERAGAVRYMGTFAEGRAMLAAVGSIDVHPHAVSDSAERAVWDRDYARVAEDMKMLESFFLDVAASRLSEDEARQRWASFVATEQSPQGAFYTVGYLMSRTVEEQLGRERLIASLCEPLMFLRDYNRAAQLAGQGLPMWSEAFLNDVAQSPGR